jgi:L-lactate dehydrogenase complex protein LldG
MSNSDGDGDARGALFARVRAALAGVADKRPLPDYPADVAVARGGRPDLVALFKERLEAVRGRAFDDARALAAWLAAEGATRGYCDPALAPALSPALGPGIALETALDRARIDDYRFGITRAAGAIAETGSLILDDATTSSRLGALAPWIHVAVLAPARLHATVADALAALGDDPYVVFCTGPSKTADVEGIMIEGVHGPGEQVALIANL